MTRTELLKIRRMIEKASASLADTDALETPELFPEWAVGIQVVAGKRYRYDGKLYRCNQPHVTQEDWTPDVTPALWTNVAEPGTIPVWVQPTGAQDAYNTGDQVWFPEEGANIYESMIDANVWSPEVYPAGWKLVNEATTEEPPEEAPEEVGE